MDKFVRFCMVLAFGLACLGAPGIASAQDSYPIGPGDVIDVSIVPKPELNREMTVGLDGKIYLPLIGYLNVQGRTIDQLREDIPNLMTGAVYRDRINGESVLVTIASDEVLVEVASYRPIYVDGAVEQPGALPFTVGLTLRQAVAAAQGFAVQDLPARTFTEDNPIAIQARLSALKTEMVYFDTIASGRKLVENTAFSHIEILSGPAATIAGRMNMRLENAQSTFDIQNQGLDESIARAETRLNAEQTRMEYLATIAERARAKVTRVEELAQRGFASTEEVALSWDQYLSVAEGLRRAEERLDTLEAAKQDFLLQRATAENQRRELAYQRLIELESAALDLAGRLRVAQSDPSFGGSGITSDTNIYTVHRQSGDQYLEFEADTGTLLMPGDVLNVRKNTGTTQSLLQITENLVPPSETLQNRE